MQIFSSAVASVVVPMSGHNGALVDTPYTRGAQAMGGLIGDLENDTSDIIVVEWIFPGPRLENRDDTFLDIYAMSHLRDTVRPEYAIVCKNYTHRNCLGSTILYRSCTKLSPFRRRTLHG